MGKQLESSTVASATRHLSVHFLIPLRLHYFDKNMLAIKNEKIHKLIFNEPMRIV